MKRLFVMCIVLTIMLSSLTQTLAAEEENTDFIDVPKDHWAASDINRLRSLGITNGKEGNRFGLKEDISRAEFVTFLVRLRDWSLISPLNGSYTDNTNNSTWYYSYIETALVNGVIDTDLTNFRPLDNITREEMGIMIVNSLGYKTLTSLRTDIDNPFTDVTSSISQISMLTDFGIVNGLGNGLFAPKKTAKREEAAAILIRMYNKLNLTLISKNAFYADSSYSQIDLIQAFDTTSFGWSKLLFLDDSTISLDMSLIPLGYEEPLAVAKAANQEIRLNIYASNQTKNSTDQGLLDVLLNDESNRSLLIQNIKTQLEVYSDFDGIVIDFEEMNGTILRDNFNSFLSELDTLLTEAQKSLTVMVHPTDNYNAYDFRYIGKIADSVIMMAHDYNAKTLTDEEMANGWTITPLAPINDVYKALLAITDTNTGVEDISKVILQLSFATAQWGVNAEGHVDNKKAYTPTYASLYNRLIDEGTTISYGIKSYNPFAEYYNEDQGLHYTIWYEDARSIAEKIKLSKMFNVKNISIWRLGNIPNYTNVTDQPVYMNIMDVLK